MIAQLLTALILTTAAAPSEKVAETEYFRFHDASSAGDAVDRLIENSDKRVLKLCAMINTCDRIGPKMDVYVADDANTFADHFPPGNRMAERAVGVAFPYEGRIVLRTHGSALFSLSETFDHEISHILVHRAAGGRHLPRWLLEGLAIWQAGESVLQEIERAAGAAFHDDLIDFQTLDRNFPTHGKAVDLAYAQSALFVRWLYARHGRQGFRALLAGVAAGHGFDASFLDSFGATRTDLAIQWEGELQKEASVMMFLRDGNFLWVMMALLIVWAYIIKRRERKAAIAAMDGPDFLGEGWEGPLADAGEDGPTLH
jgi:hypothetical protein